ncbi:MAG: SDR family oxidoreductase [Candidatus Aenigmarchaeota archaeon]|nr:SDR family oxidoreductase [Candidatus Aenigmarchaeota archaeon]
MEGKNVLVTGGAGFIGSHICERLLKNKNTVFCVDNLVTGTKDNVKLFLKDPNFTFIEQDVSKHPIEIDHKIDYIFHLASPASPVDYQKYPIETMMVNSIGTLNVLNFAKKKGATLLFSSTSEVYGDPQKHPQSEDYWGNVNTMGPRSCYDESKRFAEALTFSYHQLYGIDVKIARIFNTYGPRMRANDGRAIPNFVSQSLAGRPVTVYGDGKQTRSFCYISDMVNGLITLIESKYSGEPFNIGNPDERKIVKVAEMVQEITETKSKIVFKPLPKDDPAKRRPDIKKSLSKLRWEPKIGFSDGLKLTIDYFRNELV